MKMYCIFSKEAISKMGGVRGKMAAQAGHAYLHSFWNALDNFPEDAENYRHNTKHSFKIALVVPDEASLITIFERYQTVCGTTLVRDAGFTVFNEPTVTCVGIGPIPEDKIGEDIKNLPLFK